MNSDSDPQAQIGILLVPGLADRKSGETLVGMGEPIIAWLCQWLEGLSDKWIDSGVRRETLHSWLRAMGCFPRSGSSDDELAALGTIAANEPTELELNAHLFGSASHDCLERRELLRPMMEAADGRGKSTAVSPDDLRTIAAQDERPFLVARARVVAAELQEGKDAPAHARLQIDTLDPNGEHRSEDWLFAEARWAQDFVPPSPRRVGLWSAFVSPYVITTVFLAQFHLAAASVAGKRSDLLRTAGLLKLLVVVVLFPAIAPLTVLLQLLLLLLAALAVIPLEVIRTRLQAIQWALSTLFGDSYIFVESTVNHASIVARVKERLDWLSARCRKLVIVAESHGAYVALEALLARLPEHLRLFVSVGSGIERVSALRGLHTHRGLNLRISIGLALVCCYMISAAVYRIVAADGSLWSVVAIIVATLFYTIMFVVLGSETDSDVHQGWFNLLEFRGIRWLDYSTAYDPVSGPSPSPHGGARQEVANLGSVLFDHTAYWGNKDQFIPSVTHAIARAGESHVRLDRLTKHDGLFLEFAARWRPYRVRWLKAGWWLATLCWLAVGLRRADDLGAWGAAFRAKARAGAAAVDTTIPDWLLEPTDAIVGAGVLVLAWSGSCALLYVLWSLWDRRDTRWLAMRRIPLTDNWLIGWVHFFAHAHLMAIAAMVWVTTRLFLDLGWTGWPLPGFDWVSWSLPFGLFFGILASDLQRQTRGVLLQTARRRGRTLLPREEANALLGPLAGELWKRCPAVNRPFDAMAFDDAMYSEQDLLDETCVANVKAEMEQSRREADRFWDEYRRTRS